MDMLGVAPERACVLSKPEGDEEMEAEAAERDVCGGATLAPNEDAATVLPLPMALVPFLVSADCAVSTAARLACCSADASASADSVGSW